MNTDHRLPPLRDLPPGQLSSRKQHLSTEITSEHQTRHWLPWTHGRPVRIIMGVIAASALIVAPALAISHLAVTKSLRNLVGLTSSPPVAQNWVHATLTTPIDLHARPGTQITLTWTFDHHFGGGGIFARLTSASGAPAEIASAHGTPGHYTAKVEVPEAGTETSR